MPEGVGDSVDIANRVKTFLDYSHNSIVAAAGACPEPAGMVFVSWNDATGFDAAAVAVPLPVPTVNADYIFGAAFTTSRMVFQSHMPPALCVRSSETFHDCHECASRKRLFRDGYPEIWR